jgi:hypothetical protein
VRPGADLTLSELEPLIDLIADEIVRELIEEEGATGRAESELADLKKPPISKREHESSGDSENQGLARRDHRKRDDGTRPDRSA